MLEIVFVSDYVCPYCLVGKELLKQAAAKLQIEISLKHQSYELTREPEPQVNTFYDEERKERYKVLNGACKELHLNMKIPPKVIPRPYSRLAFEGWYFAEKKGMGDAYDDMIYRAYFIEEKDIGNLEVLCETAADLGLDVLKFREALEQGAYKKEEADAVDYADKNLEIVSLPTMIIHGKKQYFKEYTLDEAIEILQAAEK